MFYQRLMPSIHAILHKMEQIVFVVTASLAASLLSSMSGGGASVLSLPVFLWAGIPLPLAIAAHKVCAVFWTPVTAHTYLKGNRIDWKYLSIFAVTGLIGAYFGVRMVLSVNAEVLKRAIGFIILALVLHTHFKREVGVEKRGQASRLSLWLSFPIAFFLGLYESVLGSGNGLIFAAYVCHSRGYQFLTALGSYFGIAFFWVSFAALLYIRQGYFDLPIMAAASVASIIGAYIGSKYTRSKGNRFAKRAFVVIGILLGVKMAVGI